MERLNAWMEESAEAWGVPTQVAWMIFWLPFIGAVLLAGALAYRPLYRFLVQEDGIIEWAQFACFLLASIAGAAVAFRRIRAGHPWQGLLFAGFALAMFFIAGEEIAWAQRLLGLETPEELREINTQQEITVHNIPIFQDSINILFMLIGGFGAVAALANRRLQVERLWNQANFLFAPPLFLASSFLMVFAYKFVRFTLVPTPGFVITKYGEWPELCMAFGLCAFAWLNQRRLKALETQAPLAQMAGQTS
jgi:hypothetical protein